MKNTITFIQIFLLTLIFTSCSKDDDTSMPADPLAAYHRITSLEAGRYEVAIYGTDEALYTGYNELMIGVRDTETDELIEVSDLNWKPVMHMNAMMHSAPASPLSPSAIEAVSTGYLIFQMPSNSEEYWELKVDFTVAGTAYSVSGSLMVASSERYAEVVSFMGNDENRYVLALKRPFEPEVATNDIGAYLYKMEDMMTFSPVTDLVIGIDPRMPGMGNHSSPNNEDLLYDSIAGFYKGKLSLTMTGYWVVNLLITDGVNVIKGEEITEDNLQSNLYLEVEL
ncbi:hypothetical protein [Robertkochia solimangrovi]|uniref:hypothetical protein n=1 Tax=Robertkochia solimangrovi TaxID=2213046 RepID=UPI00117CC86B|nr:hypothetical protein [Robertkochia solimangrovi]TRZ42922.1 hypothetical protein DMZ48_12720 [Robertkochia solimangrovi]